MAGNNNVTFRFNIDMNLMTVKGRKAAKILQDLERASGRAGTGFDRMGASANKAGQQTAASAVNFQTATQGMLNLSTAAVQTFTSLSNLDRARNRAKMSVIAVARAEDLLANKMERQNTLRLAGQASSQKYLNITKEISTAAADLTVKTEKMGIEQGAVNDIYMLFAANIANVTISSMQTIGVLLGQEKMARVGVVAATKLQSLALRGNTIVGIENKAAIGGQILMTKALTWETLKLTKNTMGLTAATKVLIRTAWPLLAITAAVTAAYLIYDNNILNVKDGLNKLMGVEKDQLDVMKDEREGVDSLTASYDSLSGSIKKLTPVHKQYLEMMRDATINTGNFKLAAQYQAQLLGGPSQGFSSPSGGGGQFGTGGFGSGGGGFGVGSGSGGFGVGSNIGGVSTPSPVAQAAQNYAPGALLSGVNFNAESFNTAGAKTYYDIYSKNINQWWSDSVFKGTSISESGIVDPYVKPKTLQHGPISIPGSQVSQMGQIVTSINRNPSGIPQSDYAALLATQSAAQAKTAPDPFGNNI